MGERADRYVAGEQLVIPTVQRLLDAAQCLSSKARTCGGPVPTLRPDMSRDSLGSVVKDVCDTIGVGAGT